jgi:hypothetical protein
MSDKSATPDLRFDLDHNCQRRLENLYLDLVEIYGPVRARRALQSLAARVAIDPFIGSVK